MKILMFLSVLMLSGSVFAQTDDCAAALSVSKNKWKLNPEWTAEMQSIVQDGGVPYRELHELDQRLRLEMYTAKIPFADIRNSGNLPIQLLKQLKISERHAEIVTSQGQLKTEAAFNSMFDLILSRADNSQVLVSQGTKAFTELLQFFLQDTSVGADLTVPSEGVVIQTLAGTDGRPGFLVIMPHSEEPGLSHAMVFYLLSSRVSTRPPRDGGQPRRIGVPRPVR